MRLSGAAFFVAIHVLGICKKQQCVKLPAKSGYNLRGIPFVTGIHPVIRK